MRSSSLAQDHRRSEIIVHRSKMASPTGGVVVSTRQAVLVMVVAMAAAATTPAAGFITNKTWRAVQQANRVGGPFVGLVVPNAYEMDPVLKSPSFKPSNNIPILDVQGRLLLHV